MMRKVPGTPKALVYFTNKYRDIFPSLEKLIRSMNNNLKSH